MVNLGDIRWLFKKTTDVAPDLPTLKQKVLSSLGSLNGPNWVAGPELIDMMAQPDVLGKLRKLFANPSLSTADEIMLHLKNDMNFNKIFEIAE